MHQKKNLLISTLIIGMLVLCSCDSNLPIVEPKQDDYLITVSHTQNGTQVVGGHRFYIMEGNFIMVTSKGKVTLHPGNCYDFSTGQIGVFDISTIVDFNKELNSEAVKKEIEKQNKIKSKVQ